MLPQQSLLVLQWLLTLLLGTYVVYHNAVQEVVLLLVRCL
jgi:hypothetical protein